MLLGIVLAADGLAAFGFGAPGWLAALYIALGFALAAVWARYARNRAAAQTAHALPAPAPPPSKPVERPEPTRRALGYVCLDEDAEAGGLGDRKTAIRGWCARHGLELATVVHDDESNGDGRSRPSLRWALEQIAKGQANLLVVSRLRDLSTNVANLPPLLRWFTEPGRSLVALDLKLDTATEAGRLAAEALAGVGGWEHERISARTRRGLEAARSRGGGQGRTAVADVPELHDRIAAMREQGMTLQAIADTLNEEGVPTLRGGAMWRPSSVQRATGYRRPSSQGRSIELPRAEPDGH
ncbi:recombinase family protein [Candidatus Solirubrobacter pratensis]|uniref:recombinase family protein n=1 Tax=Candidatus Solirubrobacter pratensis TaxID=1298857 RepID=UPI000407DA6A|nr:recombinase family protein [Candidatus Solirubrobacter pratensis]